MPKEQKEKNKSLTVSTGTHGRVLARKFKRQTDESREVSIDEVLAELLDQTEPRKKLKRVS